MKIHLLYEYGSDFVPHGSSYIRLLWPYQHRALKSLVTVTQGIELDDMSADVYIIERMWRPDINLQKAEETVNKIKRAGKKLVYTLDDNLLDLQFNREGWKWPSKEQKNVVRLFAKEADGIIVSTEPLKQRFLKLNKNIQVVPNALDERIEAYNVKKSKNKNLTFGYMGTPSHDEDLMMILPAIREILRTYEVEFQIVGVLTQDQVNDHFQELNVKLLDTTGNVEYPNFVRWMGRNLNWDFAIAPLDENEFSICKSDIKMLDYGIFGIPSIFSDLSLYREHVVHKENGYLCRNTIDDWMDALEYMITKPEEREKMGRNVKEYVLANRTLQTCSMNWYNALVEIIK
ncbi:MAG: hypothetical protein C6P35_07490 [Cohnella sp.]|uniref:glycosyltransferase n=1 Tax=Cohnella sp. TaxID=1883426 RepID=UPI000E380B9D|nr:glycosyltransferase [Cohnella sp.]REK66503.1 MAG: hypothetical protein C6P35_07490 [Cohnella sp.]